MLIFGRALGSSVLLPAEAWERALEAFVARREAAATKEARRIAEAEAAEKAAEEAEEAAEEAERARQAQARANTERLKAKARVTVCEEAASDARRGEPLLRNVRRESRR